MPGQARTMEERARRLRAARKRAKRTRMLENLVGIRELYNSKDNAKTVVNSSRAIKRILHSKADRGLLDSLHDPHSNRAPKTTGDPKMLVGLAKEVVGKLTRNDLEWLVMATSEELRGMADQMDWEEAQHASVSDEDASSASAAGKLTGPDSGQSRLHPGRTVQSSQSGWTIKAIKISPGKKRRQRRQNQWQRQVVKRCRQRKTRTEKQKAPNVHESGVPSQADKVVSFEDKPPAVLVQRIGAPTNPNAMSQVDSGVVVQDHLLMVVKAVVQGTCVLALVDSGVTRSFVSDKLTTRPRLNFIGAYSSLELANGETIVSTGIAPDVLVCIGKLASRVSLTAVPMLADVQVILGRDWLNMVNPLIDWKTNSLVLRVNNELEIVKGVQSKDTTACKIFDKGLLSLHGTCSDPKFRCIPHL